ncbi:MAG: hypothetical protein CMP23_07530 [Rickettsiales bacterium]|nr:hypothetical protein [Rickettsiales bacterium]
MARHVAVSMVAAELNEMGPTGAGLRIGPARTPEVIKDIMLVTTVAFLAQWVLGYTFPSRGGALPAVLHYGGLHPERFWSGMIWQPVTTLLLHGEVWHLVGNLFFLWMFGCPVAEKLGKQRFLALYVGGGIAGGLLNLLISLLVQMVGVGTWLFPWQTSTIGASGAVFAVVTYYCLSWPDRPINLLFVPLAFSARWLIPLELLLEFSGGAGNVSHAAHLCGIFMGWFWFRRGPLLSRLGSTLAGWQRRSRRRSGLRIVDGDDDGPLFH